MNLETACCVFLSVTTVCVCVGAVNYQKNECEIAKAAASAGLVQQVIHIPNYAPLVIWVKEGNK